MRTQDDLNLDVLRDAGATEVVPETIEGSLMLASHALALVGVPMRRVLRIVQNQRDARYNLLRGYFHGADDDSVDDIQHERLVTLTLAPGSKAIGRSVNSFALHSVGVRMVSLRPSSGLPGQAKGDTLLHAGDTLVLSGKAEALAIAEQKLLQG